MTRASPGHVSDDRLIDLAQRLLNPPESDGVLAHVRVCPECETRFREVCREAEILRLGPLPVAGGETAARPASGRRRALWAVAAAAVAAVALLLALELRGRRPVADGLDYWLPTEYERILVRSGGQPAGDARFSQAIEAYRLRDTQRVAELLQQSSMPEAHDPLKLVLASALVWERRYEEAKVLLDGLDIYSLPMPWRDRANWILLTALRRKGDSTRAEGILRELASRPGEFRERARRALDTL